MTAPKRPAPFHSAEAAWFWTIAVVHAASDPVARPPGPGPCRAEDVLRCLDALYRHRRIDLLHARILRIWGLRGVAPNPARPRERSDWRVWHEALERLEGALRAQGIVTGSAMPEAAD